MLTLGRSRAPLAQSTGDFPDHERKKPRRSCLCTERQPAVLLLSVVYLAPATEINLQNATCQTSPFMTGGRHQVLPLVLDDAFCCKSDDQNRFAARARGAEADYRPVTMLSPRSSPRRRLTRGKCPRSPVVSTRPIPAGVRTCSKTSLMRRANLRSPQRCSRTSIDGSGIRQKRERTNSTAGLDCPRANHAQTRGPPARTNSLLDEPYGQSSLTPRALETGRRAGRSARTGKALVRSALRL